MLAGGVRAGADGRIHLTEPPATDVQTSAIQVAPRPLLVVTDAAGVRAASLLLDDAVSAGLTPAGLCLPLETLASGDAALEEAVARLGSALTQHTLPACLVVRPVGPEAASAAFGSAAFGSAPFGSAPFGSVDALRAALTRARSILGTETPIVEARLDLSGAALTPVQAADQTTLVAQVVGEIAPEAHLRVVLGGFSGVDAGRPSGASAYLTALDRWHEAQRVSLAGSDLGMAGVDLALDDVPPRIVALAQDWLRSRGIAAGVQLPGAPNAVERLARPLLLAGGNTETLAVRLPTSGASGSDAFVERTPSQTSPALSTSSASRSDALGVDTLGMDALGPLFASLAELRQAVLLPRLELRGAPVLALSSPERNDNETGPDAAHPADSNSPAYWDRDTLYVFTSVARPRRSAGASLFDLGPARSVRVRGGDQDDHPMRWIEAVYKADNGRLYGWYHEEPADTCPERTNRPDVALTAPRIGAMRSDDEGRQWRDLGIVLEAPARARRCDTANHFFAGGVGDFSVIPDRSGADLYFVFSSFGPELDQQGIGLARISRRDLDAPVGAVRRWSDAGWTEPGIGGRGAMLYPATTDWHRPDANALWGPAVHWNTHLDRYVLLFNRARDADWSQAGAYVAFAENLAEPLAWTIPQELRAGGDWYVQAMGTDTRRRETDTLIGRTARYFEHGVSRHELVFHPPGE